jgi:hypothetical protein
MKFYDWIPDKSFGLSGMTEEWWGRHGAEVIVAVIPGPRQRNDPQDVGNVAKGQDVRSHPESIEVMFST